MGYFIAYTIVVLPLTLIAYVPWGPFPAIKSRLNTKLSRGLEWVLNKLLGGHHE